MDHYKNKQNFIIHTMNKGLAKAADAFTRFVGCLVRITGNQSVIVHHGDDFRCVSEEEGTLAILVTQVIGDYSGKSFLVLTEQECKEIYAVMGSPNKPLSDVMKDAVLLEIDNIISASVIAELANVLRVVLYGDVPQLIKVKADQLQEVIDQKIADEGATSVIYTTTTLQFHDHDQIHPQFIWKISTKIFEGVNVDTLNGIVINEKL